MSVTKTMKKLGVQFDPPSLILVYQDKNMKLHRRVMPIRSFNTGSNINFFASQLQLRHKEHLNSVPQITIEKMLRILQEHLKGRPLETILETISSEYIVNPEEDLNKLTEEQLHRKKMIMDASFIANQLQPTDPDFEYDRQVDFEENKIESGWDLDSHLNKNDNADTDDGDDFWG
ncbi:centrosomal protein of 19 kDa-like [Frankliniella occidentalis]|uniref:Centrosomal protein of 19 kDa n=1 Tax=Frankliniella occidentalis TaxID=133901 RepID=A0A6J1S2G1_FRAOC|nr:centrosomal protein of 19 kDa-like [Frankliniella occidentalis]